MKKTISILLVLIMVVCLFAACDNSTEQQKAQKALEGYTLQQANSSVTESFTLPGKIGDYDVTWESNNESALSITTADNGYTAIVKRGEKDADVVLSAVITVEEGVEARRGFLVTVVKAESTAYIADNTEHFDDITKTMKLNKDYVGKNFWTDGIGEARVDANGFVDGDTTRFRLLVGNSALTIRYYEVDTPESTGQVEKWGVAASQFTKQQLSKATEIVLEATTNPPSHDNYGVRYLAYIWYRTSENEDFKCLNLELVENGYGSHTGTNTAGYPYYNYFDQASKFARSIQLRQYSRLADPLYNDNPVEMTIKDFWDNTDRFYNSDLGVGSKVVFYAYITDLKISTTGTHTFTATEYDPETGKTYSINVYTAYESTPASRDLRIGHMYKFVGSVQLYSGNTWQITDINFSDLYEGPKLTNVYQANYYLTFNSNFARETWSSQWGANFYGNLTVKSVGEVVDGKLTFTAEAYKRTGVSTFATTASEFTFTVSVPAGYAGAIKVGSELSLAGLQFEAGSGKITVLNYSDITVISAR